MTKEDVLTEAIEYIKELQKSTNSSSEHVSKKAKTEATKVAKEESESPENIKKGAKMFFAIFMWMLVISSLVVYQYQPPLSPDKTQTSTVLSVPSEDTNETHMALQYPPSGNASFDIEMQEPDDGSCEGPSWLPTPKRKDLLSFVTKEGCPTCNMCLESFGEEKRGTSSLASEPTS